MSQKIQNDLETYTQKIYSLAGETFNINSPKQLQAILFEKLKLKTSKKTKTGYSTDTTVLESLSKKHELAKYLVQHRKLHKLKTTYLDALPKLINPNTNRIHTSFNQTLTKTGRLSSSTPNLQNIPIQEAIGKEIRKAFHAQPNQYILSADYSQIELRILAHITKDPQLINAFQNNHDLHTHTATLIFKKDPQDISPAERRIAKTINFSVIYGIGPVALSKNLHITRKEAHTFIEQYFQEYQAVQHYIESQKSLAYSQGYVETLLKRRRYIPELQSTHPREKSFGERIAINTPIQGSSADIIKIAMLKIHKKITTEQLPAQMIIQIHDELVFEVTHSHLTHIKKLIQTEMETAYPLIVPLKTSISHHTNWAEAH